MSSDPSTAPDEGSGVTLLGAARVRELADRLGVRPTKQWGQNFVVDANTVRRIVRAGGVTADDHVVEIGPGLGSLTLALLEEAARVTAVEVDPTLAAALPGTVAAQGPAVADHLTVVPADALTVTELPGPPPTALVANLPYNISVPVVLHFLETFPTIERVLVMVQLEVAERLAAGPGSKTYGVPSVKAAWWADVALAGRVPRSIFWPVPNVDSGLVRLVRREPPPTGATRSQVFAVVDAAFAQRRKTLRASLKGIAGTGEIAEEALRAAGIDPRTRGEQIGVADFARVTEELMARVTA
ncbi:16S rRNA (adenine(1518)-N(6)/adenine(1519)-N(6))-dimethyltransferase RsmA [Janibacter hoylei]|uniref:16S rRNA (adenine(1518)-N(6)/adenine(1519)-N(6))- dimethyltransferase RsmA n=1 Tax=Janibacter hoylei TaxID=364298 RepID=UPI0021A89C8A|nr:16S rRNA (adenine(1518)-N(6)/adenine(1519)-N(6))-dimethyltransferase RsmA [Janibacter hoylei]MCT1618887.1 16S rRNA (adenine(1518)-N(6)/adenine(1519)-N(6))-dimethyltransferase RsmA [Janibacter hoylei]MCT2292775.1 16S rRNA (adenine(1518)-N(6)/adenine(1519)-N(6))-dimethyltransferase RsmA [Janibacter hoylei]MCW4601206.1 16S rRNA (adenine(1518)-N(6)/adenine(1519)-N(6))-dimethyltransferase RsmA [Janibacter hoylei]